MPSSIELRRLEFDARQRVRELRLAVFDAKDVEKTEQLVEAERELQRLNDERAAAERNDGVDNGSIVTVKPDANLMGPDTTGLEAQVDLRMSSVPTSIVHLFTALEHPLVTYEIRNATNDKTKRLRLISYVEGYSATVIDTVELKPLGKVSRTQMPTFFADRLRSLTELTRATLNVEVQDLDAKTEVHRTIPIWLLARSTAPLSVKDPSTGKSKDLTQYLGAFVTPNAPEIMAYLPKIRAKHPHKRIVGYQLSPEKAAAKEKIDKDEVASQVKAMFQTLKEDGVGYVNSVIDFTPESDTANNQRVRVPRESLKDTSANCIDGAVLMASLLEAMSLNPAIVIIPGHAFLGWETWKLNDDWRYLETTMVSSNSFEEASTQADLTAAKWQALDQGAKKMFKRWSLRDLRAMGITPLE
jgi:hypothetical protein